MMKRIWKWWFLHKDAFWIRGDLFHKVLRIWEFSIQETSCEDGKIAADQGDSDAMYNYGLMLYKGEGVSMNK